MKKLTLLLLSSLFFAAYSQAGIMLNGNDLGDADLLVTGTGVLSGEQAEVDWANLQLGTTYTKDDLTKDEPVYYQMTDDYSHIAFELGTEPAHFLVKDGQSTLLFSNMDLYSWAVLKLSDLSTFNLGEMTISHVTSLGGASVSVPEPATIGLLALGLIGLGAARKRQSA